MKHKLTLFLLAFAVFVSFGVSLAACGLRNEASSVISAGDSASLSPTPSPAPASPSPSASPSPTPLPPESTSSQSSPAPAAASVQPTQSPAQASSATLPSSAAPAVNSATVSTVNGITEIRIPSEYRSCFDFTRLCQLAKETQLCRVDQNTDGSLSFFVEEEARQVLVNAFAASLDSFLTRAVTENSMYANVRKVTAQAPYDSVTLYVTPQFQTAENYQKVIDSLYVSFSIYDMLQNSSGKPFSLNYTVIVQDDSGVQLDITQFMYP